MLAGLQARRLLHHRDGFRANGACHFAVRVSLAKTEIYSHNNDARVKSFLGVSPPSSQRFSWPFLPPPLLLKDTSGRTGISGEPRDAFVTLLTMMESREYPCSATTSLNESMMFLLLTSRLTAEMWKLPASTRAFEFESADQAAKQATHRRVMNHSHSHKTKGQDGS